MMQSFKKNDMEKCTGMIIQVEIVETGGVTAVVAIFRLRYCHHCFIIMWTT